MLKAIIIDDEAAAVMALQLLIGEYTDNVEVVATATEAKRAIHAIEAHRPDIVFLDICMPDMDGFSILGPLQYRDFNLVFTTAHEQYALQAIKHHASDYLLKPVDIDELKAAVENVTVQRAQKSPAKHTNKRVAITGKIGLPVREGVAFLSVADIVWVGSDGSYCTFHTSDSRQYVVSKNIGEYEDLLPSPEFFRAHKSHLINIRKVKKYIRTDGYYVEMEDGSVVEISRRKKDEFLQLMGDLN